MKLVKLIVLLVCVSLGGLQPLMAIVTFDQLDDDVFVVSHRVKIIGSRGKAMRVLHEKVASVCVAAGYEYYKIADQESQASQQHDAANASLRAKFYFDDADDDRIGCTKNSSQKYIEQAAEKLAKKGYKPSARQADAPEAAATKPGTCTVEQITSMVTAGMTKEQIKAACGE